MAWLSRHDFNVILEFLEHVEKSRILNNSTKIPTKIATKSVGEDAHTRLKRPNDTPAPRICLLAGNFYPVVGGGERHAHLLCREWTRRGAKVFVLTRRRTRDLARREQLDGFEVHRVGPTGFARTGKYLMLGPALWQLWRRRNDYDVLYVCGLRVLGFAGILAQALTGKPCVLRAEARGEMSGEFIWKTPEGRTKPLHRLIFRPLVGLRNLLYRRARHFLSISTPITEEFLACGIPAARIEVIPNGLDLDLFSPAAGESRSALRQRLGLPEGLLFAYSGKLNRGKGLELLLRVWALYAPAHPQARLVLIGSGAGQHLSCEEELRRFVADRGLEGSVIFTGYVEAVTDYLHASDAFVFPSESEAQGLSVLEALACKIPVIASRIPGIMDMVENGESGTLVEARDEDAWTHALEAFDPDAEATRRQIEAGYATARDRFGIAAICERHLDLFARKT